MEGIGDRIHRQAWQHLAELMLEAAERNGSMHAVRQQLKLALIMDAKLDVQATEA